MMGNGKISKTNGLKGSHSMFSWPSAGLVGAVSIRRKEFDWWVGWQHCSEVEMTGTCKTEEDAESSMVAAMRDIATNKLRSLRSALMEFGADNKEDQHDAAQPDGEDSGHSDAFAERKTFEVYRALINTDGRVVIVSRTAHTETKSSFVLVSGFLLRKSEGWTRSRHDAIRSGFLIIGDVFNSLSAEIMLVKDSINMLTGPEECEP